MTILIVIIFITGYLAIAFEGALKLNKASAALLTGVLCWAVYAVCHSEPDTVIGQLQKHLSEISSILFFVLGAMTIVELIDSHDGFVIITDNIKTRSKLKLFCIISFLTFFISSFLDNLTTAIVMTSLVAKLLAKREDRLWFAGMIVIAANAGGVISPLGDVTTTMLWIGGQMTAQKIIMQLFLPGVFVCLIPTLIIAPRFRNQTFTFKKVSESVVDRKESMLVLVLGFSLLLFVPVFKMLTHLPPFMGILLALSVLWVVVTIIHFNKPHDQKHNLTVTHALEKIDTPSVLFFLGILLAIAALQSCGLLSQLAVFLDRTLGNIYLTGTTLGLSSAIIDNVPLVAAAQGMYDLTTYPADHRFWEFIALTTGTGGSIIIIGSAAGVASMGLENIDFMWYLKKISWIALVGFLAGIAVFILEAKIFLAP